MTPTLGLDLKPGVSQRLSKVIIHGTCDGHRVGHRLCFFVVFSEAAAEVLLNHRVAYCVGYNNKMCGKSRPRGWLLPKSHIFFIKSISLVALFFSLHISGLVNTF